MAARRETALAAFTAALAANLDAAYSVVRDRTAPLLDDYSVTVIEGAHRAQEFAARDDVALQVTVTACRLALAADDVGAAASQLHADIVAAALADVTLGGAADHVRQIGMDDPEQSFVKGRRSDVLVAVNFLIEFQTQPGDPST